MFGIRFRIMVLPALALAVVFLVSISLMDVGCKKHEHPAEHPEEKEGSSVLTKDKLADAVEEYVSENAALYGGYFIAYDEKKGEELKLTLDKVHRERLSRVGEELYFACADFTSPAGKVYDLDVFMEGSDKDNLKFSEFMVHKEAGKERYTWYEEGGIWERKSVGVAAEHPAEHPIEHPNEPPKEHPEAVEHPNKPPREHPREHPSEHPE